MQKNAKKNNKPQITDFKFCDSQDLSLKLETITFPVVFVVLYSWNSHHTCGQQGEDHGST